MAIFYTDTGSLGDLKVSGSVVISGSGTDILSVYGSQGNLLSVSDLISGANVFQIASASIDVFKVNQNKEVHISGSLIVTGSISGNITASLNVSVDISSNNVSQLVFSNANNVSFGLNGSTITATVSGQGFTYSYYNPFDGYQQVTNTLGSNSLRFFPVQFPNVQYDRIAIPLYLSHASNSTFAATLSFYIGLYTRNGSTLSLLTNNSIVTGLQTSFSSTNSVSYHGIRMITAGLTNTLTEGQYYAAFMSRITTAGNAQSLSNLVVSQQNSSYGGLFGVSSATQTVSATQQYTRGLGQYTATTSNLPASVAFTQILGQSSQFLRPPIFYFVSQTF
jgi:hypothetical protein